MDPAVWTSVKLEQGMWPDIAPRRAKGFVRSGQWMRWREGQMEPMGGWEKTSFDQFTGKARKVFEWGDNSGYQIKFIGTHIGCWAEFDGEFYNITPIEEYAALSAAIDTIAADPVFVVNKTAHGYVSGMYIRFPSAPTVDSVDLDGEWYEITRIDANSFSFNAGSPAVAGGTGLGGNYLDMDVFLRPGLEFSLAGAGYGTGAYDIGLYGGTLATAYRARTYTCGNIGELLCMVPRGGAFYEFGPTFFAADLAERVTNGTFTGAATGWTLGAGWAYGSNDIDATTSTGSVTQSITVPSGRWIRIRVTVSALSGGTLQVKLGSTNAGAVISAAGRYTYEVWNTTASAQNIELDAVTSLTATVDDVTVKVMDGFAKNTDAPASNFGVVVTPQGIAMVYGTIDGGATVVDPLLVRCCSIDNTHDWTPSNSNQARSFFLYDGTQILQGLNGADGQAFFLTDSALWEGRYTPGPIFDFSRRSVGCGGVGARGACYSNRRLYWASNQKQFYYYDGAECEPVFCPGEKTVFDNISGVQGDLIELHAHSNGEVFCAYPDARDGNEVSRYAHFNRTIKWSFGTCDRTAWTDVVRATGYPIGAATDGYLYFHEKGVTADGVDDLNWSARATGIEIGDGNTLAEVSGFINDAADQRGPYSVRFIGFSANQNSPPQDSGNIPVTLGSQEILGFFIQGRQIDIEFSGDYYVRLGDPRYLVQDTGNQF